MQNLAIKEPDIEELEESSSVQAYRGLHTKVGKNVYGAGFVYGHCQVVTGKGLPQVVTAMLQGHYCVNNLAVRFSLTGTRGLIPKHKKQPQTESIGR